jgi:hypothetical protein
MKPSTRRRCSPPPRAGGLPLTVLDIDATDAADVYSRKLVLSRPDQHVAWASAATRCLPIRSP